jgi:hypothetical protein
MDKSDNILDNLTTVNGKEEFEPQKTAKKKAAKKTVKSKPLTTKTPERLNKASIEQLAKLCEHFKVPSSDNKQEMINTLLGK